MAKSGAWRSATAAAGAAATTGYASGRALVIFFMQLGAAAWPGVALASAGFGLLLALCAKLAIHAGAGSFGGVCRRTLGGKARIVGLFHGLLLAMAAAVAILNAGEVGALTLPLRRGFLWGMAFALALAVLLNARGGRGMACAGAAIVAGSALFYAALALDPRPPRLYLRGEAVLTLSGSLPAMLALALCNAALNASIAADAVCRRADAGVKPRRLGLCCAAGMALPLLTGCAALTRGGPLLLAHALPVVPLAARWGLLGFWLCAALTFACNTATLAAALLGLRGWFSPKDHAPFRPLGQTRQRGLGGAQPL